MPNNKAKGNSFERECSRMLSLWWTNGKRDDAIWRSASSGALTTVGKGRYLAHTGDFAATDGEAELLFKHVIIEAKRGYNRYSVQDLLDVPKKGRAKNPVWEMFTKLRQTCLAQKKIGLLLWKRDRRDLLVLVSRPDVMSTASVCLDCKLIVYLPPNDLLGVLPWVEFESTVSADQLRSLLTPPVASSALTPSTPS